MINTIDNIGENRFMGSIFHLQIQREYHEGGWSNKQILIGWDRIYSYLKRITSDYLPKIFDTMKINRQSVRLHMTVFISLKIVVWGMYTSKKNLLKSTYKKKQNIRRSIRKKIWQNKQESRRRRRGGGRKVVLPHIRIARPKKKKPFSSHEKRQSEREREKEKERLFVRV